jgi:hypothetical protein
MQVLIGVEHTPQEGDCPCQAFIGAMLYTPDLINQFLAGDDFAGPVGKRTQHFHDLRLQPVPVGTIRDAVLIRLDQQSADPEFGSLPLCLRA